MTAREWTKENCPTFVDDEFVGGVMGCPHSYTGTPVGELIRPYACSGGYSKSCAECWDRELPEVT